MESDQDCLITGRQPLVADAKPGYLPLPRAVLSRYSEQPSRERGLDGDVSRTVIPLSTGKGIFLLRPFRTGDPRGRPDRRIR